MSAYEAVLASESVTQALVEFEASRCSQKRKNPSSSDSTADAKAARMEA